MTGSDRPPPTPEQITVTTHVGRDILQSARLFRTVEAAVWEYIVNSLEYVDPGVLPTIRVSVSGRDGRVEVADNGRGMDADGLRQFFTMHGENPDRRRGIPGRGQFGTGKSAAFGIGTRLLVDTVRGGRRNVIELHRRDIDESEGAEVPTRWVTRNEPVADAANGTTVVIDGITARRLSVDPLIRRVERHLAFWRALNPTVLIGSHLCQPWEPDAAEQVSFTPTGEQATYLGSVTLAVRVSRTPLDELYRGVAVTAGLGNLVALETAGIDTKEFGNYLFGEIDVPALLEPALGGTVVAFDTTRSLSLNYDHPVAATLVGFIGSSLEAVRKELVRRHREAKKAAEAKELDRAADEIAQVLNRDLEEVAKRLAQMEQIRRRTGVGARARTEGTEEAIYVEGAEQPGLLDQLEPRERTDTPIGHVGGETPVERRGEPAPEGPDTVSERRVKRSSSQSGGLTVEFRELGEDEERSLYDFDRKVILINLEHPAVEAALKLGGVEDLAFRRLSYEIAFTQYALAIAKETYNRDPGMSPDDALYEVRDALRRVTRSAARLYGA